MAFPDVGTFIIEESSFGDGVTFEPNHHCNVGTTGFLCMPQYVLHRVDWGNRRGNSKWVTFQSTNFQNHNANQSHGGIFTLSPPDATLVMNGKIIEKSFFPPGFVSLVSSKFNYLLSTPNNVCVQSSDLGKGLQYDDGILCRVPLRALKIYTKDLLSGNAPSLTVDVYYSQGGVTSQTGVSPDISTAIPFHQVGKDNQSRKQGYSLPVIPGINHSYKLSLDGESIPTEWVVEFSDVVLGNRWNDEYIYLKLMGRSCGTYGLVSSRHDRRYMWSGDEFLADNIWGNHGACSAARDMPEVDCAAQNGGIMSATSCPDLCAEVCDNANSFCDCATAMCKCKEGFMGPDCSVDLCKAARCGEHGHCAARYLGTASELPITSHRACICDVGWSGPLCTFNPCLEQAKSCSGNGQCVASNIKDAACHCDPGFSGNDCDTTCNDVCVGNYPFGCSDDISNVVEYGCNSSGGCHYLKKGDSYPSHGYCTYKKSEVGTNLCKCDVNDCQIPGPCIGGQCSNPLLQQDLTPCNSVPFGVCVAGSCTSSDNGPTPSPHVSATISPTIYPPSSSSCGCQECSDDVLNQMAGQYSCGSRITWLQSPAGNSMTEQDACVKVANEDFSESCGPQCDPLRCR